MTKFRMMQANFGRGELDPLLDMRSDIQAYRQGARTFKNVTLKPQGAAMRRPGMQYLKDLGALATATQFRMFKYAFNDEQEYLLVFSPARLDIFNANSIGTAVFSLTSGCPWTSDHLAHLYLDYRGDTIIIVHPLFPMRKLVRTGNLTFDLSVFTFEIYTGVSMQPRYKFAPPGMTLDPSGPGPGSITLTVSDPYWVDAPAVPNHIGNRIWYKGHMCVITSITSPTVAVADVADPPLPGGADPPADTDWAENVFNDMNGYARTVCFHDNRLIFGGSRDLPDGFWASKIDAYYNFDPGTGLDDESIWAFIGSSHLNEIRAMVSGPHLQLYTNDAEFYVPASESNPLSPKNMSFRRQSTYGANFIEPQYFDGATLFFQDKTNVLREFLYNETQQAYSSESVSLLSGHLIKDPVNVQTVSGGEAQTDQFAVILNLDGTMAQFQSLRAEEIAGWARWVTDGVVLDICAVSDKLFLAVKRTIDGVAEYWLEKLNWGVDFTLDGAVSVAPDTVSAINCAFDIPRFTGHTVQVVSAGVFIGNFTVGDTGTLVIPVPLSLATIGLDYEVIIEPMIPDADTATGPITGERKRVVRAVVGLKNTRSMALGGQPLLIRHVSMPVESSPSFTGKAEFWLHGWSEDANIRITQPEPLRMTVLGVHLEIEV
jgi:hypothetical protein